MDSWTEYRIDFSLLSPTGRPVNLEAVHGSRGFAILSLEEAEDIASDSKKSYEANGFTVLSYKISSRTVTYTDWKEVKT